MDYAEIADRVDIADYISQYVDLEEKNGELWGLSPFNAENTPSFSVRPESKYWYDFSAGCGGNIVDFIMRIDGVGVYEAIAKLKRYANIQEEADRGVVRLEAAKIAKRYRSRIKAPPVSTAKILPSNYMDRYEFRKDKLRPWADEGISYEVMLQNGVRYDAFDDRIVYPVKDFDGNIISVCGRTCDAHYKEKRISKYIYFQQMGTVNTLYAYSDNAQSILESREIILFEGAKSCLKMSTWGYTNTSAILTSHLSVNQLRFLIKLSSFHGVRIVFALDSDVNILKDKHILSLTSYASVEWVKNRDDLLSEKESPVDRGRDVWEKLYMLRQKLN